MIVSISLNILDKKELMCYYYIDLDKDRKTVGGMPSEEFMQHSGLYRVAEEFVESANDVNFYFKIQDKKQFFINCLKFGLTSNNYQLLDLEEKDILEFAALPGTLYARHQKIRNSIKKK